MANLPDDVFFATIGELGAKLRAREFSSVELTRAYCDRLEKIGPKYNALALSLRKQAMRMALILIAVAPLTPLYGVPMVRAEKRPWPLCTGYRGWSDESP